MNRRSRKRSSYAVSAYSNKRSRSQVVPIRYGRSYPRYRGINTRMHNFVRNVSTSGGSIPVDSFNGFSTGVFDLQFSFALSGVTVYLGGTTWQVFSLPNYTELTALYDQYRIDYVEMEFFYSVNTSSGTTFPLPIIYLAKDYNDPGSAPVTILQQYENCVTWQIGEQRGDGKKVIRVKPNVDINVYNTPVSSGYARSKPIFIDTNSPNVPHYGAKLALDPIKFGASATTLGYMSMNFKYHLTMLHTR